MWFAPTTAQCKARLRKEWAVVASAVKAAGEDEDAVIQRVIDTQVTRIRGRVSAKLKNQLGATGTIPDELEGCFLALWVYSFLTLLPGLKSLLDERRVEEWKSAESELRHVAEGKISIVPPETAADPEQQAGGSTVEVVNSTPRRVTRSNISGLF